MVLFVEKGEGWQMLYTILNSINKNTTSLFNNHSFSKKLKPLLVHCCFQCPGELFQKTVAIYKKIESK